MNVVGAIRKIVLDDAATVALLFNNTSVYPTIIPQKKECPAIRLMIADTKPNDSKTQVSGIDNVHVSATIFADSYDKTQLIDTALRNAIDGFSGGVTTSDSVVHYIDAVRFLTRIDDYDPENLLFVRQCMYDVRYFIEIPAQPFGSPYQLQSLKWPLWNNDADAKAGGTDERGNVIPAIPVGGWYLTGPLCDFAAYGMIKVIME